MRMHHMLLGGLGVKVMMIMIMIKMMMIMMLMMIDEGHNTRSQPGDG